MPKVIKMILLVTAVIGASAAGAMSGDPELDRLRELADDAWERSILAVAAVQTASAELKAAQLARQADASAATFIRQTNAEAALIRAQTIMESENFTYQVAFQAVRERRAAQQARRAAPVPAAPPVPPAVPVAEARGCCTIQ